MAKLQNGAILWQGASLIDGAPIVVIATGIKRKSQNAKTGAMIQTFIIRSDVSPVDALKSGADRSVCGDCPKRPIHFVAKFAGDQACYVDVAKSVRSVYAAFRRGIYPTVSPTAAAELFAGRKLRLGAYGNPSAAPYAMWEVVASKTAGRTGYIHNWQDANPAWSNLVMASVEGVQDGLAARRLGYRLFRVRSAAEPLMAREIACPASKEAGHKTSCFDCLACGGHSSKARVDIAIIAH